MSFLHRISCVVVASILLLAGSAHAVTFNFEESIFSNFDTLQINGVTFTANPAGFADYGEWFAFDAEFVQNGALLIDPNASVTLQFSQPLSYLQFGAAVGDTGGTLADLASIQVFDGNGHEVFPVWVLEPQFGGLGDAERQFAYQGTNLKRAIFGYDPFGQSVLAVDNMTITPMPVPEPAAWVLMLAGCALLVTRRARATMFLASN
jgi:hypothetical protein